MRNCFFVFFYSGYNFFVGLAIVPKITIAATNFVKHSISLLRWYMIFGFSKHLGKSTGGFVTHFDIFYV